MLRMLAIVLVVVGSCLFCVSLIGTGWSIWAAFSGASLPGVVPGWLWLGAGVGGGVLLAIVGRETMKRAENR